MTIDLELEPQREAKLLALANAKGLSADDLVREVVHSMLDTVPEQPSRPKKSLYGLWSKYGPGPSEHEIEENRREMFHGFAEDEL